MCNKSEKEMYDMSNISLEYAMNKTKEFYNKVEERKNSNKNTKSIPTIPVNELLVYKIAKEMMKKLDDEE